MPVDMRLYHIRRAMVALIDAIGANDLNNEDAVQEWLTDAKEELGKASSYHSANRYAFGDAQPYPSLGSRPNN